MLKELLQVLTGTLQTASYTNPSNYGINVPPQATFKKIFSTLTSSLNNAAGINGYSGIPSSYGTGGSAIQAYQGALTGYQQEKHLKAQALAPGAVISGGTFSAPQAVAPAMNPAALYLQNPIAATGQLQGSANLLGGPTGRGLISQPSPYMPGQYGFPQSGGGKLQLLLMPIISIISFIKSIFGLGGLMRSSYSPIVVDKNNTGYNNSLIGFQDASRETGSFDEYYPEEIESETIDTERLQNF